MLKLSLMALSGAAGTLSRYWLAGAVQRLFSFGFPWGTFTVNMLGSFLFGLVWALGEERLIISGDTRAIVLAGFMGAFTTFSTFMFETGELIRDSEWLLAGANIVGQSIIGITFLFLGIALARAV